LRQRVEIEFTLPLQRRLAERKQRQRSGKARDEAGEKGAVSLGDHDRPFPAA